MFGWMISIIGRSMFDEIIYPISITWKIIYTMCARYASNTWKLSGPIIDTKEGNHWIMEEMKRKTYKKYVSMLITLLRKNFYFFLLCYVQSFFPLWCTQKIKFIKDGFWRSMEYAHFCFCNWIWSYLESLLRVSDCSIFNPREYVKG